MQIYVNSALIWLLSQDCISSQPVLLLWSPDKIWSSLSSECLSWLNSSSTQATICALLIPEVGNSQQLPVCSEARYRCMKWRHFWQTRSIRTPLTLWNGSHITWWRVPAVSQRRAFLSQQPCLGTPLQFRIYSAEWLNKWEQCTGRKHSCIGTQPKEWMSWKWKKHLAMWMTS